MLSTNPRMIERCGGCSDSRLRRSSLRPQTTRVQTPSTVATDRAEPSMFPTPQPPPMTMTTKASSGTPRARRASVRRDGPRNRRDTSGATTVVGDGSIIVLTISIVEMCIT